MRNALGALTLTPLVWLGACVGPPRDADGQIEGITAQRYPLELVLERARQIPIGTSRARVMAALGSPAYDEFEYWRYVDNRPGVVAPTKEVHVYFERGVYTGYEVRPVVLGLPW
ncbi:MAG: hypothetical protein AAGA57_06450 [Planctomycetota bacterium]